MTKTFPLAKDCFGPDEIEAAVAVLRSGRYTMGERVREFESELATWFGARNAIMVNSGSSANLLMVEALIRRTKNAAVFQPGDEVLVPALAWPTTVWPLIQLGLVPVYVDVDPSTLAISLESARSALSSRTKGMFLIHVLGLCAEMEQITKFCLENGLSLLEDCCESFGAFYKEKSVGTFGAAGSFSHFFSHHLTTMEGGTIITDDEELADDLRSFRAHGWIRDRKDKQDWLRKFPEIDERFFFASTGYNVRPLEIEAAIGLVQLKRMDGFLEKREEVARKVFDWTKACGSWLRLIGAEFLPSSGVSAVKTRRHSWMNIPFILSEKAPASVQEVKKYLEAHGVETRPIIAGNLARHPANQKIKQRAAGSLKMSDDLFHRGFMIGCHPMVEREEFEILEKAFQGLNKEFS